MMRDLMPKCQFLKRNISCWVGKIEGNPCGPLVSTGRLFEGKITKADVQWARISKYQAPPKNGVWGSKRHVPPLTYHFWGGVLRV